jgi:hypothetical protein
MNMHSPLAGSTTPQREGSGWPELALAAVRGGAPHSLNLPRTARIYLEDPYGGDEGTLHHKSGEEEI